MKISVRNGFAPESSLDRVDKIVYSVLKLWGVVLCRRELNGVKAMMLKKLKLLVGLLAISGMMMADVTLDADINLTADADWSGRGTITVPAGIVVNLNGHRLVVDNITGDGRIIDTAATYDLLDGITSTEGRAHLPFGGGLAHQQLSPICPERRSLAGELRNGDLLPVVNAWENANEGSYV